MKKTDPEWGQHDNFDDGNHCWKRCQTCHYA